MIQQQTEKGREIAAILEKLAEELKFFPKETAQLLYARQLAATGISVAPPVNAPGADDAGQRLNRMMEEARLKWEYASEAQKKQVTEMEERIRESNDQIRKLYEQKMT